MATLESAHLDMKMRRLPKGAILILHVQETRELKSRLWVAARLMRLVAWVLGCSSRVEIEGKP